MFVSVRMSVMIADVMDVTGERIAELMKLSRTRRSGQELILFFSL